MFSEKSVRPPSCESPVKFKSASLFLIGNFETNWNSGDENSSRLYQCWNKVPSFLTSKPLLKNSSSGDEFTLLEGNFVTTPPPPSYS